MKNLRLNHLLADLNSRPNANQLYLFNSHGDIYKYQIAPGVEYARIWNRVGPERIEPQTCFFIREDKKYTGIVEYKGNSIYCYSLPEHRATTTMSRALRSAILPYLFFHEHLENLQVTLNEGTLGQGDLDIAIHLAQTLGFKKTQQDVYTLSRNHFKFSETNLDPHFRGLTLQEFESTKLEFDAIAKRLLQLDVYLQSAYGKDSGDNILEKLSQQVRGHQNKLVKRAVNFHKNEADSIEREHLS